MLAVSERERERDGQSNIVWYFVILYVTVESANKERERESNILYIDTFLPISTSTFYVFFLNLSYMYI